MATSVLGAVGAGIIPEPFLRARKRPQASSS